MAQVILPIPGWPGYHVSSDGHVYSTWTFGRSKGPHGPLRAVCEILAPDGRMQVGLHRDGQQYTKRVHGLVLLAFVGPRPAGMQACHFPDRDTQNNASANLRWDTASANQGRDKKAHGTSNHGERNGAARLTEAEVRLIRSCVSDGRSYIELATKFAVSPSAIRMAATRLTWKEVK